jgi:hypothetical protein
MHPLRSLKNFGCIAKSTEKKRNSIFSSVTFKYEDKYSGTLTREMSAVYVTVKTTQQLKTSEKSNKCAAANTLFCSRQRNFSQ